MINNVNTVNHQGFTKLYLLLLFVFCIHLAGFFSWNENVLITRILKLCMRTSMTFLLLGIYYRLKIKGLVPSFRYENSFVLIFYGLYLLLGLFSFLWSSDPLYSALQWFMDIQVLLFAFYLMQILIIIKAYYPQNKINISRLISDSSFFILLIFIVGKFLLPSTFYRMTHGGELARLGGWMMNPNELGMLCAVGVSCSLYNMITFKKYIFSLCKICILIYALFLTGSRSSLIGLILIILFYILTSKQRILKTISITILVIGIPFIVQYLFLNQGGWEEIFSLTGRIPFWNALITEGLPKEPIWGYGFMRIAYEDSFQGVHTYAGQMTHNTFLQVLMNLGLVGFFIVLLQLTFTIRAFYHLKEKKEKLMLMGLSIPILINSFTEFGIFGENNFGILFYYLILFSLCIKYNPKLTLKEKLVEERHFPSRTILA
ncbi:MAG: O-antigen ligase family protein [Chitinophagales bacterium]